MHGQTKMDSALVVRHTFLNLEVCQPWLRKRADTDTLVDYCSESLLSVVLLKQARSDNCSTCTRCSSPGGESWADASDSDSSDASSHAPIAAAQSSPPGCFAFDIPLQMCPQNNVSSHNPATRSRSRRHQPKTSQRWGRNNVQSTSTSSMNSSTVVLRKLPKCLDRNKLQDVLETHFAGCYNFLYLPMDFKTSEPIGHAIVNFVTAKVAASALLVLRGIVLEGFPTIAEISNSHDGIESLIKRYRTSAVMEPDVPEQFRPLVFSCGRRVPFP